jgi:hypothetical protein
MKTKTFAYQAYYCEENIWQLCQQPPTHISQPHAILISNPTKSCALWHQRAATHDDRPVVWDYHVIFAAIQHEEWWIWDLDTTLPLPVQASAYLDNTFAHAEHWPQAFVPMFRIVPATTYIDTLASDRSHMLDNKGQYLQPPPPWDPPGTPPENTPLMAYIDMTLPTPGRVLTLPQLYTYLATTAT